MLEKNSSRCGSKLLTSTSVWSGEAVEQLPACRPARWGVSWLAFTLGGVSHCPFSASGSRGKVQRQKNRHWKKWAIQALEGKLESSFTLCVGKKGKKSISSVLLHEIPACEKRVLGWVSFLLSVLFPEASHPPKGMLWIDSALIIDYLGQMTDNDGMTEGKAVPSDALCLGRLMPFSVRGRPAVFKAFWRCSFCECFLSDWSLRKQK